VSLQQQITDDIKTSMKARDKQRTSALRMLLASMKNAAVAAGRGPQGELSDDEVIKLLQTETKRRREAATAFRDAGRAEQAAGEDAEAAIYEAYLPAQLSDEELGTLVSEAIAEVGADNPSQMGQVMKAVMPKVAGRADGARVSGMVKERLGG
jgi:uncharacterized protein YqeY